MNQFTTDIVDALVKKQVELRSNFTLHKSD